MFSKPANLSASSKIVISGVDSPSRASKSRKCSAGEARTASYRIRVKLSRRENSLSQSFIALTIARTPNLSSRSRSLTPFCLRSTGALGSRLVICKYRETKQSRGSRTSKMIFARLSSVRGTRYLPLSLSQRPPLVRCSNRS